MCLNLPDTDAVIAAAALMPVKSYLIEEMITEAVAELLVGVVKDPAHGFILTIGAGGILTELLKDTISLLLPSSAETIEQSLTKLKCYYLLTGYRGKPAGKIDEIVNAILCLQDYVLANVDIIEEVEINPLICTTSTAIAADALIRIAK